MTSPPKSKRDWRKIVTAWDWPKILPLILSVLMVIVLALQLYTLFLALGMSRNDQRAWVSPVDFGVPVIQERVVPSIAVIVTNHGKTPAVNLQKKSTYSVFAEGQHPEPQYTITDPREPSTSILFPGERQTFYATYDAPLIAEEVRDIEQGTRALHLFVEITYEDFFGESRRTALAQVFVRSPSDPSRWEWRILGYYNEVE